MLKLNKIQAVTGMFGGLKLGRFLPGEKLLSSVFFSSYMTLYQVAEVLAVALRILFTSAVS